MKKALLVGVIGLLIGIGGYYFVRQSGSQGAAVGTSGTIKLGAALGLSGECAVWGEDELKATQLAVSEVNKNGGIGGKKIELVVEDIQCDPKGTVNAMKKLIEVDHVVAIAGPTWGDSFQAGFTVANTNKIVAICSSCILEALEYNHTPNTYAFSTYFPAKSETEFLAHYVAQKGIKRIYLVHDNDPFGFIFANEFANSAKKEGVTIVGEEKLLVGQEDFRTVITAIKAQKLDAVFVSFQAPASQAKFLKQSKELGLKTTILSPSDIEEPSLLKDFGLFMEGVLYARPTVSGDAEKFQNSFKEFTGADPSGPTAPNAYDAAQILLTAIRENAETGVDIKTAVENIRMPGTIVKEIKFDGTHQIYGAEYQMKTVRNGQFVVVE